MKPIPGVCILFFIGFLSAELYGNSRKHKRFQQPYRPPMMSNGTGVGIHEYLGVGRLVPYEIRKNGKQKKAMSADGSCSSVILNRCILTAKHCLFDGADRLRDHMFVFDRLGNKSEVDVKTIHSPSHRSGTSGDIAIAKLKSQPPHFYSTKVLAKDPLPNIDMRNIDFKRLESFGIRGIPVGFGLIHEGDEQVGVGIIQKGTVRILGDEGVLFFANKKSNGAILSFADPSRIEVGDSGGPLFSRNSNGQWVIAGITTAGNDELADDEEETPGPRIIPFRERPEVMFHACVSYSHDWIMNTLDSLGCSDERPTMPYAK